MRPIRTLLLAATVGTAVYAWISLCVLWANWLGSQYCGDGVVQEVYEFCGDGVVQKDEACDVWSVNWSVCVPSYWGSCTYCNSECQRAVVNWPSCGDGIVNENETCDDANKVDTDECNNLCQKTFCWDNVVQAGEVCDAWSSNWVKCNPWTWTCTFCTNKCKQKTLVWARCWDGKVNAWEECDDGNSNNADACNNSCKTTFCWDGVEQAWESCDEWSANGMVCTPWAGKNCNYCSSTCSQVTLTWAMCGDGKRDAWETCDDWNLADWDWCSSTCLREPTILLDTWAWVPEKVAPPSVTKITFGGEPVSLPAFLPSTGWPETTYRWVELNK